MDIPEKLKNRGRQRQKGNFTMMGLVVGGILIGVLAIALSVMATILTTIQSDQTSGTHAFNATANGLTGITNLASWIPTIATIIVTVFILGLLIGLFVMRLARMGSGTQV